MEPRSNEEMQKKAQDWAVEVMKALSDAGAVNVKNTTNWCAVADRVVENLVQLQKDALL